MKYHETSGHSQRTTTHVSRVSRGGRWDSLPKHGMIRAANHHLDPVLNGDVLQEVELFEDTLKIILLWNREGNKQADGLARRPLANVKGEIYSHYLTTVVCLPDSLCLLRTLGEQLFVDLKGISGYRVGVLLWMLPANFEDLSGLDSAPLVRTTAVT